MLNAELESLPKQQYVPKVKTGHVVPEIPLDRVKDRLSKVKGALVEAPIVCFCSLTFLASPFCILCDDYLSICRTSSSMTRALLKVLIG